MITVNSISGGKTSSYIAVRYPADYEIFSLVCINEPKARPKDRAVIDYVNGKIGRFDDEFGEFIATAEDDKTLKVMMDLEQMIGREIIWVRGKSFDNVIDNTGRTLLPNKHYRYCTEEMKLLPIFLWWWHNIHEKVNMRIGFRFCEVDRMERFFNNSDPTNFSIPTSCKNYGNKMQRHENYNWRFCSFPLIRDGITEGVIKDWWHKNGFVGGNLFEERRRIDFPVVSNCVGCFHKKPDTICIMSQLNREKIEWFSKQEEKNMGTWHDSKIPYSRLIEHGQNFFTEDMIREGASCDSGGCTD